MSATWSNSAKTEPRPYAEQIDAWVEAPRADIRFSTLGHQDAYDELLAVWKECSQPNWDGYGALPVQDETFHAAYRILKSLPLGFPRPSLGAEPDGQITFEWHKSSSRTLSVSVDPDGFLHYAGLFGCSKRYGTLEFFGAAPAELTQLVREL